MNCSATTQVVAVGSRECVICAKYGRRRRLFCLYAIPDLRALRHCRRCACGRARRTTAARDPASDRACCGQGIVVTTFAEMGVRFLGFPRDHLVRSRSRSKATYVGLFAGRSFDEG